MARCKRRSLSSRSQLPVRECSYSVAWSLFLLVTQQPACPSSAVAWPLSRSLLVTQQPVSVSLICCSLASLSSGDSAASLSLICCCLHFPLVVTQQPACPSSAVAWPLSLVVTQQLLVLSFAATSHCSADSAATLICCSRHDAQSAKNCTRSQTALTGNIEH